MNHFYSRFRYRLNEWLSQSRNIEKLQESLDEQPNCEIPPGTNDRSWINEAGAIAQLQSYSWRLLDGRILSKRWVGRVNRLLVIYLSESRCFRKIHSFGEVHDQIRERVLEMTFPIRSKNNLTDLTIESRTWLGWKHAEDELVSLRTKRNSSRAGYLNHE